jgi:hypothetical protein
MSRKFLAESQKDWGEPDIPPISLDTPNPSLAPKSGHNTPLEEAPNLKESTPVPNRKRSTKTMRKEPLLAALSPVAKEKTIRVSVDLPERLFNRLQGLSNRLDQPKAEIIRRLVEQALDELDTH